MRRWKKSCCLWDALRWPSCSGTWSYLQVQEGGCKGRRKMKQREIKKVQKRERERRENIGMRNSEGRRALQDWSEQLPSLPALLLSPLSWQWLHTPATSYHRATLVAFLPRLTLPGDRDNSISSSPPPTPTPAFRVYYHFFISLNLHSVAHIPLLMK